MKEFVFVRMELNRVNGFLLIFFEVNGNWSLFSFGASRNYIEVGLFGLSYTFWFDKQIRKMLKEK